MLLIVSNIYTLNFFYFVDWLPLVTRALCAGYSELGIWDLLGLRMGKIFEGFDIILIGIFYSS